MDKKGQKQYETYKKVSTLGVGSFGTAYLVECQSNKELAVIKQVDIQTMSEDEKRETLREAKILEVLNHPNIVRFREVYKTKKGKLCIVMDYADGGDLQSKIKDKYKNKQGNNLQYFSEENILNWFTQICLALKHCHDRKILHRDLKAQNVFLTKRNIVKLGDFGIARVLSTTISRAKTVVGTPYYLSPEIIENKPYNFKSDIWSLGVLLYEMCSLKPPFNASSLANLARNILQGKFDKIPSHYSAKMQYMINALLVKDPRQRPTINEVLKMPMLEERIQFYLKGHDFKEEFSHTLLHNQDVFKEFQKINEDKKKYEEIQQQKKQEEERKKLEEIQRQQQIQNQMANLLKQDKYLQHQQINQNQNQNYYNYCQNNDVFNQQYQQYIQQVYNNDQKYQSYDQYNMGYSENVYQDRDDQISNESSQHISNQFNEYKEENLDLYTCDFAQFSQHMIKQYGQKQFNEGFAIISKYKQNIYTEEGEEQLVKMLKHLFKSEDLIRGFLNFCTSYIIVQNYSQNINAPQ